MDSAPTNIPGTTNLASYADKRLLVVLRDGRKLYGILRSYDQFGNLLLEDTIERYYQELEWAEEAHGMFIVRGENVVMLGELDEEEFKSISRRMSKFKRPLETFLPRYKETRVQERARRRVETALGIADVGDFDFY